MAELTGQTFAGYEIIAKLGEGGMGAVYKAKQPVLNRFVALKTMAAHLGGDKEFVARFQREAASAATLNHPNVVAVHTAGEVDSVHYIVMEFVDGESVRKRLDREGRIPPAEALAITIYVAQALQYAWNEARLIHRDIKPDNIFISKKGEVKVGDLGLAKSLATEGTEMTATGTAMGSPHYISPEQATGIRDIDFRTDIYSLGCTLYHMLTGQTPYRGDSSMIVMMKHVNDPPPAIFKAWPQCPMPLGMLVGRMLAKDRNARPKSYEQLIADLFAVSEKLQQPAAPAPAPVATSKPAVVEKAAAPTMAPATSPDAPTVALQSSSKPKSLTTIYAAAGVAAVLVLGGLFLWSPWKGPPSQDSSTPSLQHSISSPAENWQDWIAEQRRSGTMPKDCNDNGGASLSPKRGTTLTLAKSIRNGALRVTFTLPKVNSGQVVSQVVLELRNRRSDRTAYGAAIDAAKGFVYRAEQGQINRMAYGKLPAGFDPGGEMTLEFRVVGEDLICKLNSQIVVTCRDSMFSQEGEATIRCSVPGIRVSRIEVLNLDGVFTSPSPTDAALKQLGNVYQNAVGGEMVAIPPGEFMLGSTPEERAWAVANGEEHRDAGQEGEQPRKTAIKQGFWMGRTEVTVGQWKQFVAATGYVTISEKKGSAYSYVQGKKAWGDVKGASWKDPKFGLKIEDNHPVVAITWTAALEFCEWLNEQEQKAGRVPPGFKVRLPTEAEWEYACRAGTQTKFWWGDTKEDGDNRVNWIGKGDGFEFISPVDHYGARGRNNFGLADMLGNVWEWCLDEFDVTQAHAECYKGNPDARVMRGGAFYPGNVRCRSAFRVSSPPSSANTTQGFRVCLGPDVPGSAAAAVSNASPVISNWQDVMPFVRAEMDKTGMARHENGWSTATQARLGVINMCDRQMGDVAVRGRFRNNIEIGLAVSGPPSKSYLFKLKRGGGTLQLRRYVNNTHIEDQPLATLRYPSADEHGFLITKVGDLLSAWVDGAFAGSARDSTLTSGNAHIYLLYPDDAIRDLAIADLSATAPASADAGWRNAINLLPLIDPQKDAVKGEWHIGNGELMVNDVPGARLEIPYQPPQEYDFRIVFTRQTGKSAVWQILTGGGRSFDWCLAAMNGTHLGFELISGRSANVNASGVQMKQNLENGCRYTSEVQVRRNGAKALLDGRLITEWKTDYRDMSLPDMLRLRGDRSLGIGAHASPTIFHRVEVREVTGKGTFTRGAPGGAFTTPTLQHSATPAPWLSAFCAEVAVLPAEQQVARVVAKLKELNPGYDGKERHKIEDGAVVDLTFSTVAVTDISPVRALSKLRMLNCYSAKDESSPLTNLQPLQGLPLTSLACNNTKISDLSPLKGMPLSSLNCSMTPVADLSPLARMPLKRLLLNYTRVSDLSPLKGMALTYLDCENYNVGDLSPLEGMPLEYLNCKFAPVKSFSPLKNAPLKFFKCDPAVAARPANGAILRFIKTLETINGLPAARFWKKVDAGEVPSVGSAADPAFLREVAALPAEQQVARVVAKLKELNPGYNGVEEHTIENGQVRELKFSAEAISDVSPVRALTTLERFECVGSGQKTSPLADLSPLNKLPLMSLMVGKCQLSDLTPLKGMSLKRLTCYTCNVSDLSPLEGMPLTSLNFSFTKVTSLQPLKGMPLKTLIFYKTLVSDLSPLRDMRLTFLDCHNTQVNDLSVLENMSLESLQCDAAIAIKARNAAILRSIKRLKTINNLPAAEFWQRVAAGQSPVSPDETSAGVDDLFLKEVAALPAEQQVARVVAKLKELNPGFDGAEKHNVEGNDVVSFEISAINVTDISPVRALEKLRRFVCMASTDGSKRSKLSDLSPLRGLSLVELRVPGCDVSDLSVVRGMPLDHLGILYTLITDLSPLQGAPLTTINCDRAMAMTPANLAVLRSIKTLKTISGPAQRFWQQVDAQK